MAMGNQLEHHVFPIHNIFLQSRIKIQCPNLNINIYSNPRSKSKNDHDNPSMHFAAVLGFSILALFNPSKYIQKKCILGKYNGQILQLGQNAMEKACRFRHNIYKQKRILDKIYREKRLFGQNTMEKSVKVSAKYIQKKYILGKIQ